MTLDEACAAFLAQCRIKNLSPHSLRAYGVDLQEFMRFIGAQTPVTDIDRHALRRFMAHLFEVRKLKETSIKRRIACLKVMFRWLELDDVITTNPFHRLDARIRLPRRLPRSLTHDEVDQLRSACAAQVGIFGPLAVEKIMTVREPNCEEPLALLVCVEILLCTGMRIGELANIKFGDINFEDGTIIINGKGSRQRIVFVPDNEIIELCKLYEKYVKTKNREAVFLFENWTMSKIRMKIKEISAKSGINKTITPHVLRHTSATMYLSNGMDIRLVQKILGHNSISTTQIYTDVSMDHLREVVAKVRRGMKK